MKTLPIGYRFSPTDSELIDFYLKQKVMGKPTATNDIPEADVYQLSPSDLPGVGTKKKRVFYFFAKRNKKQHTGERRKAMTGSGCWKPTSSLDEEIIDPQAMKVVGMKRRFVYSAIDREMKATSNDTNPKWTMKEYSILRITQEAVEKREEEWVICKITKKKKNKSACTNKTKAPLLAGSSSKKDVEDDDDDDFQKGKNAEVKHPSSNGSSSITKQSTTAT